MQNKSEIYIRSISLGPFGKRRKVKEVITIEELLPIQREIEKYTPPRICGLESFPYNPNHFFSYDIVFEL